MSGVANVLAGGLRRARGAALSSKTLTFVPTNKAAALPASLAPSSFKLFGAAQFQRASEGAVAVADAGVRTFAGDG